MNRHERRKAGQRGPNRPPFNLTGASRPFTASAPTRPAISDVPASPTVTRYSTVEAQLVAVHAVRVPSHAFEGSATIRFDGGGAIGGTIAAIGEIRLGEIGQDEASEFRPFFDLLNSVGDLNRTVRYGAGREQADAIDVFITTVTSAPLHGSPVPLLRSQWFEIDLTRDEATAFKLTGPGPHSMRWVPSVTFEHMNNTKPLDMAAVPGWSVRTNGRHVRRLTQGEVWLQRPQGFACGRALKAVGGLIIVIAGIVCAETAKTDLMRVSSGLSLTAAEAVMAITRLARLVEEAGDDDGDFGTAPVGVVTGSRAEQLRRAANSIAKAFDLAELIGPRLGDDPATAEQRMMDLLGVGRGTPQQDWEARVAVGAWMDLGFARDRAAVLSKPWDI